eukprot:2824901-Rhodomonas_salina.1
MKRRLQMRNVARRSPICLRRSDAMSATDLSSHPPTLAYAMSGTDVTYAAVCLRTSYALSGAELGYAATRSDTGRTSQCTGERGREKMWRCAVSAADRAAQVIPFLRTPRTASTRNAAIAFVFAAPVPVHVIALDPRP